MTCDIAAILNGVAARDGVAGGNGGASVTVRLAAQGDPRRLRAATRDGGVSVLVVPDGLLLVNVGIDGPRVSNRVKKKICLM